MTDANDKCQKSPTKFTIIFYYFKLTLLSPLKKKKQCQKIFCILNEDNKKIKQ